MFSTGLTVLIIVLLLVGPFVGFLLEHNGIGSGHRIANHGIAGVIVLGLFILALVRTDVVPAIYHVFDRAGMTRTVVAERAPSHIVRQSRLTGHHHRHAVAQETATPTRHWSSL